MATATEETHQHKEMRGRVRTLAEMEEMREDAFIALTRRTPSLDSTTSTVDETDEASALALLAMGASTRGWPTIEEDEVESPYERNDSPVDFAPTGHRSPSIRRNEANKKRRANENERIRHLGWVHVKPEGSATGHWWHPEHGTAPSKKAIFRYHAEEPPVRRKL